MLRNQKLITCILPRGIGFDVLQALKEKRGIITANLNTARGTGKLTPLAYRGIGGESEKELLNVIVPITQADELFEFVFYEAKIDRPHGGIIYMSDVQFSTPYRLPDDLPRESV